MKGNFLLPLLLISTFSFSQAKPDSLKFWKTGGVGTLNLSQVALSNWAQGGENSLSATALFNLFSNYKNDKTTWENTLDLTYGFLQSGGATPRKSDDKIEFTSKYGHKTSNHWSLATMLNFKSQFTEGYSYPNDSVAISNLMAPGYVTISTGMDYKPKDDFSFFMSPVTGKITIVNDQKMADAGAYGVQKAEYDSTGYMLTPGEMVRYEFGALVSCKLKQEIAKNIVLSTKLDLFSNYLSNPQNVDVNWDVLINMKVNKYVSASISTTLIYDHDIPVPVFTTINGVKAQTGTGPRTQFKEVFAVGFSYKF